MTILSALALTLIPESPNYLYSKGDFNGARRALGFILKFNNCLSRNKEGSISSVKFETELAGEKLKRHHKEFEVAINHGQSMRVLLSDRTHRVNFIIFGM